MSFWRKIKIIFTDKVLRNKILFVLLILALFRFLGSVPIPGVDTFQLQGFLNDNQFLGLLNIFSGGGLSALSIVMLGVGPYITASIIMQLLTIMSPKLKAMYHEEGAAGKAKFSQISRNLTVPMAVIQGFGLMALLSQQGILNDLTTFERASGIIIVTAGSMLLTWLGELISERGIGNGISIMIFAGIIAGLPTQINQFFFTFNPAQITLYIAFVVVAIVIVAGVIMVSEAERLVPITYAKQTRGTGSFGGTNTYLPLRVNQAGVMPIIFALSILLFPQMVANFMVTADSAMLQSVGNALLWFVQSTWLYAVSYFLLVFLFTYFYTAITFDPESVATNLQKSGAFVPGIRPGASTTEYIGTIVSRITLIGALFLGLIAVLPVIMQQATGLSTLAIGGTALLIVVSVILDLLKKVDGQISMRQY